MQTKIVVSLRGVVNRFGKNVVHDGIDLDIKQGEVLSLIGGSGSGKSVLLRCMLGLRRPEAGTVKVFGIDLASANSKDWETLRKQWGILFQDGALFSSLTVLENVESLLREYTTLSESFIAEIARLKLRMVGLPESAGHKYPSQLSGGMRKRAGLARALALDPTLVFLDEPTAGLDPISAAAFDELIGALQSTLGLTVCIVTHDLDTLFAISNRVAVLADKKIAALGTLEEVKEVQHPWIQEYFSGKRGRAAQQV